MENKIEKINPIEAKFNPNLPTVLFLVRDEGGCGFYRCSQPAMALRRLQLFNTIIDLHTTTPEHILQADIVVFQNIGSTTSLEAFNFAKKNDKAVLLEVDDLLHSVSPHNFAGYPSWNPATLYIHRFYKQLEASDGMIVSTPQLAREYFPYNKNIYVIPNYLNEDKWSNLCQTKKKDDYFRIGWAGGNAHKDDLHMISKILEKIIRERKDKIKFETMGMIEKELDGAFNLEKFGATCPKCNYQGDSVTWPGESLDDYPLVLASHGWDLALAPVINTAFNNAKSDIKLKEYSAIGYPVVASAVTPYIEAKEDGCDVLLSKTHDEWYNNIIELIDNSDRAKKMIENNKNWVSKYWIDDNAYKYAELLKLIINNKSKKI